MKKIAFLIASLSNGGAERVVSNLTLNFPKDVKKYIILYDGNNIEYQYDGEIVDLKTGRTSNIFKKVFNFFIRIFKIRRFKKKNNIDTTISFLENPNITNIFSRRKDRVIISVRIFKSKTTGSIPWIYKKLMRIFYNKADIVVAVSELIKKDLTYNFGIKEEKIVVINNPYDIELISNLSKEPIDKKYESIFENPVLITVGRLSKQKGHWHLIRAFSEMKKEIKNLKLVILGKGELEDYLYNLIKELDLEEDVFLLGFQSNPFKFISRSKVFIFSSLFEGFPNGLAEAMACGIPVISSDCKSGPREILAPNTDITKFITDIEYALYGILVPTCDGIQYQANDSITREELMIKEAILHLLSNREIYQKYAIQAKKRVMDFSKDNIIKQWLEVIN